MGVSIQQLLDSSDYIFEKGGWHAGLLPSVKDLTAKQAAWVSAPGRNSIWRIVDHLAFWKEVLVRRMAGEPPQGQEWIAAHDWQDVVEPTDEAWQSSLRRLTDAHAALKAALVRKSDEDLAQPVHPGSKIPLHGSILGFVTHDSYHCGQIRVIRALQGVSTDPF